jgi:hypothetical protein
VASSSGFAAAAPADRIKWRPLRSDGHAGWPAPASGAHRGVTVEPPAWLLEHAACTGPESRAACVSAGTESGQNPSMHWRLVPDDCCHWGLGMSGVCVHRHRPRDVFASTRISPRSHAATGFPFRSRCAPARRVCESTHWIARSTAVARSVRGPFRAGRRHPLGGMNIAPAVVKSVRGRGRRTREPGSHAPSVRADLDWMARRACPANPNRPRQMRTGAKGAATGAQPACQTRDRSGARGVRRSVANVGFGSERARCLREGM